VFETLSNAWFSLPDYGRATVWILVITVVLILSVAFLTLIERKVIGWMQLRRGPNRVSFFGFFPGLAQPFADVFKLLLKEVVIPARSNKFLFASYQMMPPRKPLLSPATRILACSFLPTRSRSSNLVAM